MTWHTRWVHKREKGRHTEGLVIEGPLRVMAIAESRRGSVCKWYPQYFDGDRWRISGVTYGLTRCFLPLQFPSISASDFRFSQSSLTFHSRLFRFDYACLLPVRERES